MKDNFNLTPDNIDYIYDSYWVQVEEHRVVWYDEVLKKDGKWYASLKDYILHLLAYANREQFSRAYYNKQNNTVCIRFRKCEISGVDMHFISDSLSYYKMEWSIGAFPCFDEDDNSYLGINLELIIKLK